MTEESVNKIKFALFVFNGDPMCFIHVLLNALDMADKGMEARIIVEGAATRLIPDLNRAENPLNNLWVKAKEKGLVEGVCKACASKMQTLAAAKEQGLPLLSDMLGHPGMASYREKGFEIISF
jgi:hypothetical protein